MKKTLSFLLCLIFCIMTLCACTTDKPNTSDSSDAGANISYNDVSYFIPDETSKPSESQAESSEESAGNPSDNSRPTETSQPTQQSGKLVVKAAKYDYNNYWERKFGDNCPGEPYRDVSIAILDITNETDKHYSVTIHGKYLDKDGKVLKTETQEWDQFAAGWQKYFLFRPEIAFDKFEYTIETKEFKGDCWKTGISLTFLNLQKINRTAYPSSIGTDNVKWVEGLMGYTHYKNDALKTYSYGGLHLVLFNAEGKVIGIYSEVLVAGLQSIVVPMQDALNFRVKQNQMKPTIRICF